MESFLLKVGERERGHDVQILSMKQFVFYLRILSELFCLKRLIEID